MSHPAQRDFFRRVRERFPDFFSDVAVLDIGSLNVNGTLREFFTQPYWYTGLDLGKGDNVDVVCPAHLYRSGFQYDTVVSAECLEHDMYWRDSLRNMYFLLRNGGLLAFSCATTGRKEHGTRRSEPSSAPLLANVSEEWGDYYHNLTAEEILQVLPSHLFSDGHYEVNKTEHDLYFWGLKV